MAKFCKTKPLKIITKRKKTHTVFFSNFVKIVVINLSRSVTKHICHKCYKTP